MSSCRVRRRWRRLWTRRAMGGCAVVMCALPTRPVAQPTEARSGVASSRPLEDSSGNIHLRRLERLERQRLAVDSAREAHWMDEARRRFPDTVFVGFFRIATDRRLFAEVMPLVDRYSREVQPLLDSTAQDAVSHWTVHAWRPSTQERRTFPFASIFLTVGREGRPAPLPGGEQPFLLERSLRQQLSLLVSISTTATFDGPLRTWLFNGPVTPFAPGDDVEGAARLELATAESRTARQCVAGELSACATLLALRGRPTDPLRSWYAPEDYRAIVAKVRLGPSDGPDAPGLQRACLARKAVACTQLLGRLPTDRIPSPTLDGPRRVLLHEALRGGGAEALARLRDRRGDVGARLARAAGVTEEALLDGWRRRMIAPRGANVRPAASVALASLGWITLLGILSMRRVRRCR